MKEKIKEKRELYIVAAMVLLIVLVTGYPYLKNGIGGYDKDLLYHLLRIEGIKDALLQGKFPVRIYENFFDGYGYGSPLFYPDLFFVIPAILRILGFSPSITWKLFALLLTVLASLSTYFSFRYIIRDWKYAVTGTMLLMLSQFYLADLMIRVGISEYLAFIFLPMLVAGIYDFFARDGKKVYLMGIAFAGMLLSHTIMTFVGVMITIVLFVLMFLHPQKRKLFFEKERMGRLIKTAIVTALSVSYYLFPMLEQMKAADYRYSVPWAHVGDYVQPFSVLFNPTGYFDYIACVGIGVPILLLLFCRFFYGKPKNRWADGFYFGGGLLFLMTTSLFPWRMLNNTIFNMIQFPYRLYPYALCFLILGICMILSEQAEKTQAKTIRGLVIVLTIFFGVWQNYNVIQEYTGIYNTDLSEEFIAQNSNCVGKGEWLTVSAEDDVTELTAAGTVLCEGEEIETVRIQGAVEFTAANEGSVEYEVPFIYYKGYRAILTNEAGEMQELAVRESEHGLVEVLNETNCKGNMKVFYQETWVQKSSKWISVLTVIGVVAVQVLKKRKKHEKT